MNVPDWLRRALRTSAQAAVGAAVVILPAAPPSNPREAATAAATSAGWAALVGFISALHNILEQAGAVKDRR